MENTFDENSVLRFAIGLTFLPIDPLIYVSVSCRNKILFRPNPKPKPKGGLQFRQNRNSAKMGEIRNTLVFRKEENEAEKYQKKFSCLQLLHT